MSGKVTSTENDWWRLLSLASRLAAAVAPRAVDSEWSQQVRDHVVGEGFRALPIEQAARHDAHPVLLSLLRATATPTAAQIRAGIGTCTPPVEHRAEIVRVAAL
ncbi:hypothetical protein ACFYOT_17705 [Saccharothrix saharensis]|uniref:hypothetical protein n=1 Tax=Saccharothrix saharensis TaxID=571190 RepID=UPI0036C3365E